jgi:hypothetical protein
VKKKTKKKKTAIAGRSWKRGEVTLGEIRRLTQPFGSDAAALFADEMMEGCIYDVIVVDGDLDVRGNFYTFDAGLCGLFVQGRFTVSGVYSDTDDPVTGVFVLGNMRAGAVVTNGLLGVKGSLETTGPLVGFYNDYSAKILGDVKAPLFAPETHSFAIGGKLVCKNVIGRAAPYRLPAKMQRNVKPLPAARWKKVLHPSVIEDADDPDDLEIDDAALRKRVLAGKPVLL